MSLGTIVVLNGPPRAGKSSIAEEIQASFSGVWMNLGVDGFMRMTPERFRPGIGLRPGGERPDLEEIVGRLYLALYDSVVAHSRLGINVVVDVGHHDFYSSPLGILPACARRLQGLPAWLVGIHCPIDDVLDRRRMTGWPEVPRELVERWERAVHRPGVYDLRLDTSLVAPKECAVAILRHIESASPAAFPQLADTLLT